MEEKSFKRKNELIEAALDEFITKSYENASLNVILKNAGISKGTFYYHFQDKQALYLFLIEAARETECEFINNHMRERAEDFKEKDIFERFKLQVNIGTEFAAAFPKYYKLGRMFMNEKGKKIYEHAKSSFGCNTQLWLDEIINEAVKHGDFNSKFSNEFIVKIISHLFSNFSEIFNEEEDYELEKMVGNVNNLVDFLKCGLGKRYAIT
jgi:TetR/AcrR family transcriptional regulator